MKTKRTAAKKKQPNNSRAAAVAPKPVSLPSAEWLAEVAAGILSTYLDPMRKKTRFDADMDDLLELDPDMMVRPAVDTALHLHRVAQEALARITMTPIPLPEGLTAKEKETGRVSFERGCKLITGEEVRKRALKKYNLWRDWDADLTDDWESLMEEKEKGFYVSQLAEKKAAFEKNFKKALALQKRQKASESGQTPKKSGQRARKRRTRLR
jgi:hypothetical protein